MSKKTKPYTKKNRSSKYKTLKQSIEDLFSGETLKYFSLQEIQDKLENKPSLSTIHRALKKAKISRRNFDTTKVCLKSKEEMNDIYRRFNDQMEKFQDNEIVCIDETYLCNIGNASYGYFKRGKYPIVNTVPKRKTFSIVMAVSSSKVIAIEKQVKPFTKDTYNDFIIKSLIPSLDQNVKVVLMDNVVFHKNKELQKELLNKNISCLFIPPYSPRCNPIEEVFSIMKRRFRKFDYSLDFELRVDRIIKDIETYTDTGCFLKNLSKIFY